jgi:outer membrane protein OmpA-like peptidoglycan-associated protein
MDLPLRIGAAAVCLALPVLLMTSWVMGARARLAEAEAIEAGEEVVAVASAADAGYCTADLRKILRRVLQSCGLQSSGEVRGCQPMEARKVATISGDDFNALFEPLANRAGIIQFDLNSDELGIEDTALLDKLFADQGGASYFFVVARSSPEGSVSHNRDLSQRRGESVLNHLRATFDDPDLDKEVGLLWLGEEYAQLDQQFCDWQRSGDPDKCTSKDLNRSAFVAWIDCRI